MTNKDTGPQRRPEKKFEQADLSDIWRELLGDHLRARRGNEDADERSINLDRDTNKQQETEAGSEKTIPTLDSDPWSALLQAKGIEIVDLEKARLQISDQEVERILQLMQEYPAQDDEGSSSMHQRRRYDHED